jgi:lipoprotein
MKKWMIYLLLGAGLFACSDSDDDVDVKVTPKNKFRVKEITGKNSHWGEYVMNMVYYYETLDSVVVRDKENNKLAVMTSYDVDNGLKYSLEDYIPNIDADSIQKLYDKYGADAKDSIPLIGRELFALTNEYKHEELVAQTFVYNKAREDVGSGKDFNNKYLKNKRVRYIYEYDERGDLVICRVLEDAYKKEIKDNEKFDRLVYKAVMEFSGSTVTSVALYQSDEVYGSGEDYKLNDTYTFSYSGGLLTQVSGERLNLEYQYSGGQVTAIRYTDGERTYEYNSDGFLKRVDFGNGEYMEIKYEAGHGDFHLFTPLIENSFNLPSIL